MLRKGEGARVVKDHFVAKAFNLAEHRQPDWQLGWFEAADVPLGVLVAKAQRYSGRQIRFAEPALAELPVSGRFRVSDPDRILQAISAAYGVNVRYDRDAVLISANVPARN